MSEGNSRDSSADKMSAAEQTELEALQRRVDELEKSADIAETKSGLSKRDVMKAAWAAPVVLSVNLPNTVFATAVTSACAPVVPATPRTPPSPVAPGSPTLAPTNVPTSCPL